MKLLPAALVSLLVSSAPVAAWAIQPMPHLAPAAQQAPRPEQPAGVQSGHHAPASEGNVETKSPSRILIGRSRTERLTARADRTLSKTYEAHRARQNAIARHERENERAIVEQRAPATTKYVTNEDRKTASLLGAQTDAGFAYARAYQGGAQHGEANRGEQPASTSLVDEYARGVTRYIKEMTAGTRHVEGLKRAMALSVKEGSGSVASWEKTIVSAETSVAKARDKAESTARALGQLLAKTDIH